VARPRVIQQKEEFWKEESTEKQITVPTFTRKFKIICLA
jgi:hypothetical protein